MSEILKQFTHIANQLVWLTKNDSFANHFIDTPDRIAKYWNEIMQYAIVRKECDNDIDAIEKLLNVKTFEDETDEYYMMHKQNLLLTGPIRVYSVCAHHYAPIIGHVYVGYKPKHKILGLSKLSRIAKIYAKQPIVQELYTEGLFKLLVQYTDSEAVVITYMRHLCMESRGVNDTNSITLYYCHNLSQDEFNSIMSNIKFEKP